MAAEARGVGAAALPERGDASDGIVYLSGAVRDDVLGRPHLGVMLSPAHGNRPDLSRTPWAADNGCFAQGARFDVRRWVDWLWAMRDGRDTCLFATVPDVVADAKATLARSTPLLPMLRAMGWRAALVAQDGLEDLDVPWGAFDALFVGGSTRWKLSDAAAALVAEARRRGLWTHMGRVNSLARLRYASDLGCRSADGTFLKFGPDVNRARLDRWYADLDRRPSLWAGRWAE